MLRTRSIQQHNRHVLVAFGPVPRGPHGRQQLALDPLDLPFGILSRRDFGPLDAFVEEGAQLGRRVEREGGGPVREVEVGREFFVAWSRGYGGASQPAVARIGLAETRTDGLVDALRVVDRFGARGVCDAPQLVDLVQQASLQRTGDCKRDF